MPNSLAIALSQNPNTFRDFRIYLAKEIIKDVEKTKQLENAHVNAYIPYCINYIEYRNVDIREAMDHFQWDNLDLRFWDLLTVSIIGVFRKFEINDVTFLPF